MANKSVDRTVSNAILQFLQANQFPDTEEVASAIVLAGDLSTLSNGLGTARESIQVCCTVYVIEVN